MRPATLEVGSKTQDPFPLLYIGSETQDPEWDPGSRTFIIGTAQDSEQSSQSTQSGHCLINLLHVIFQQKILLLGF